MVISGNNINSDDFVCRRSNYQKGWLSSQKMKGLGKLLIEWLSSLSNLD